MRVDQFCTPPFHPIEMSTRPYSELLSHPSPITSFYGLPAAHLSLFTSSIILYFLYGRHLSWLSNLRNPRLLSTLAVSNTTILLWMLYMSKHGIFADKSIVDGPNAWEPAVEETPQEFLGQTSCPATDMSQFNKRFRTQFHGFAPQVFGFPSSGGVLITRFGLAVAEWLGLRRLEVVKRAEDPIEEDALCDRLRLLGAKWRGSGYDFVMKKIGIEESTEEEKAKIERKVFIGRPGRKEDGVWVLRITGLSFRGKSDWPEDFGMLGMCVNMAERCELLERWGARWYEEWREVEDFS